MRAQPTRAESHLWSYLRRNQLGYHFTRQHPVGPYVVDFICRKKKLIVEVDGGQHAENLADDQRTRVIESFGFHVIRFWNIDVLQNTDGVLDEIKEALENAGNRPRTNSNTLNF